MVQQTSTTNDLPETIGTLLHAAGEKHAAKAAAVFPADELSLSWAELVEQCEASVRGLLSLGLQTGDELALCAGNISTALSMQFAAVRVGASLTMLDPRAGASALRDKLAKSKASALFIADRYDTCDLFPLIAEVCPELAASGVRQLRSESMPELRHVISLAETSPAGGMSWNDFITGGQYVDLGWSAQIDSELAPAETIAYRLPSSNAQESSNGLDDEIDPASCQFTHKEMLERARSLVEQHAISTQGRLVVPPPFQGSYARMVGPLCAAIAGTTMQLPATAVDPATSEGWLSDGFCYQKR